jgi:hypothetical protein
MHRSLRNTKALLSLFLNTCYYAKIYKSRGKA